MTALLRRQKKTVMFFRIMSHAGQPLPFLPTSLPLLAGLLLRGRAH